MYVLSVLLVHCVDKVGTEVCHWRISNGHQCRAPYMQQDCAASCGVCGGPSAPATKPSLLVTTSKPQVVQTTVPHAHYVKPPGTKLTTPGKSSRVTISSKATSTKQAVAASVVLSNKTTDVMSSIGSVTPSNVTTTESPRVITNKPSRPATQSLNPLNMTLDQLQEVEKYVSLSETPIGDVLETYCRDENPKCSLWSAMGKCKKKSKWMKKHCCATCKHVIDESIGAECKDSTPKCPFWALAGECARDRVWMLGNCRKSCNQCGVCKDDGPKCADLALARQCLEGDRRYWILTNCPRSCGLCQVYDKHDFCPAWETKDECRKSNWAWMRDNCPMSCRIPLSEVQFCGKMKDGKYPIPRICTGFVSCSGGVTRHEMCPNGTLFHPIKRICDLAHNVKCSHEKDLTLKRNHVAR
ncbi:uncharacterized protein LOC110052591 [Orbicella faveolata]|uniref:uncharacterized protein LOC110052591 n=1 Tax=Orbicella faveolata TaxID=48498 RepID=UPI0009E2801B|nr:uncharacterized protein LOC110052591 [Orbicella faveolata]